MSENLPPGVHEDAKGSLWILPGFPLPDSSWEWYHDGWNRYYGGVRVSGTEAYMVRRMIPTPPDPPVDNLVLASKNWWAQGWRAGYLAAIAEAPID
jgi:hypothetical protein